MSAWSCAYCGASERRTRRSTICDACRARKAARGWAWCPKGLHRVRPEAVTRNGYCRACQVVHNRPYKAAANRRYDARHKEAKRERVRRARARAALRALWGTT